MLLYLKLRCFYNVKIAFKLKHYKQIGNYFELIKQSVSHKTIVYLFTFNTTVLHLYWSAKWEQSAHSDGYRKNENKTIPSQQDDCRNPQYAPKLDSPFSREFKYSNSILLLFAALRNAISRRAFHYVYQFNIV